MLLLESARTVTDIKTWKPCRLWRVLLRVYLSSRVYSDAGLEPLLSLKVQVRVAASLRATIHSFLSSSFYFSLRVIRFWSTGGVVMCVFRICARSY